MLGVGWRAQSARCIGEARRGRLSRRRRFVIAVVLIGILVAVGALGVVC